MPRRPPLALGLLLAVIPLAGCGQENPELIPQTRASALTSTIDEINSACDANDPDKAKAAVQAANQQPSICTGAVEVPEWPSESTSTAPSASATERRAAGVATSTLSAPSDGLCSQVAGFSAPAPAAPDPEPEEASAPP